MSTQANDLQEYWFSQALDHAGIDPDSWRPRLGLRENRRTVKAVYAYYGQLFVENPYLMWAGMAAMIGPTFFAGFEDLAILPDASREALTAMFGRASSRLAGSAAGDLDYYETTFLTMQKKIFEDQAPMHEAYLHKGIDEIEKFYTAGIIDATTLQAWRQIDIGKSNPLGESVADGNRMLLFREQYDIINRYYTRVFERWWPLGPSLTYLMTLTGAPAVPKARPYPQRYPLRMQARMPRFVISARTPLADGDIAIFADRWGLIETDTLPAYLTFIRDQPEKAREIVSTPVTRRARAFRLVARTGQLVAGAATHWAVDLRAPSRPSIPDAHPDRTPPQNPATGADPARSLTREPAGFATGADSRVWMKRCREALRLNLARPLTRESAGFATGADSQVWMKRCRKAFQLTVTLPGGSEYRAQTDMAVVLSSVRGGDPDRLTVRLPPVGLEAATRLLDDYAEQWGFPADEVGAWHASAVRRVSGDRHYGTHVFKGADIGTTRLEFQVSHHVRERDFVVTALFSQNGQA